MLFAQVIDERLRSLYSQRLNHLDDCGFDLYIRTPETSDEVVVPAHARGFKIYTGVKCAITRRHGYYLYPRSSIIKTPLRLANSVGIIDCDYRGEIIAAVDNMSDQDVVLTRDRSLFQLCMPNLEPFAVDFRSRLDETARGEGGFGSTH